MTLLPNLIHVIGKPLDEHMNTFNKSMAYLGVSLLSSFVFAILWVILMTLTLPETDGMHGLMPFQDPLVFPIMSMFALMSAVAAWPFYTLFGWNLPPVRVGLVAGITTLLFILLATPINAGIGWLGSYIALLISLIACRITLKQSEIKGG